jgi:pimeloyl-ACP methyl ester carboxylesterase
VRFETTDGVTLDGRVFGDGENGVVLAHMRPASMGSWFPFAETLASAGYTALAFDFRGYGASGGSGFAVDVDVRAAIDALVERGARRVFVVGASMGGTGAIVAALGEDRVAAVVTLSAPATFEGVDALAAIGKLDRPVMLMVAEGDEPYASDARRLREASGFEAELIVLSGSRHGTDLFLDHPVATRDAILGFLADPG